MKCSRNLQKHIQLLKAEKNRISCCILNRQKLDKTELESFLTHRNYVRTLLKTEKMKAYDTMLKRYTNRRV